MRREALEQVFGSESPDAVIHFAAESHVDRSIHSPAPVFRRTSTEHSRFWKPRGGVRSLVSSTYRLTKYMAASIRRMRQTKPIRCARAVRTPHRKPDRICWRCRISPTYELNVSVTRASNNYGPLPVSRKADPFDDLERTRRQTASGVWRRTANPRLVVCGGSLPGHFRRSGERRAR